MSPVILILCLLGGASGRPLSPAVPFEMAAGHAFLFPVNVQDQANAQTPSKLPPQAQVLHLDPTNPLYENLPLILQRTQLQPLLPGQTQYFPTTQMTGPLADTDARPQVYTVIIQQPVAVGSISSEEGIQQPIMYSGVLMPMLPGGPNMGITNGGAEPDQGTPGPEGILPNPENPEYPDPAPQGNLPPSGVPAFHGGAISTKPERDFLTGVRPEAGGTGQDWEAAPCLREVSPPSGQKLNTSSKPLEGVKASPDSSLPLKVRGVPGGKGSNTRGSSATQLKGIPGEIPQKSAMFPRGDKSP